MKIIEIPPKPKEQKILRVAAYARVSSDKDAAFHSLEAQTDYYKQYVAAHPDWELVAIYSDNGISGTTINRPEFQRMLQDCRDGKIDLVITKSVTRFARNTVILLETIRELKQLGVDTYFEREDMHGISPDGELLITLLAMYAEEEARSASENQKWRIQKRFEKGYPNTGTMLGYRLLGDRLVVIPEEADIVRKIYQYYLSGMGYSRIAKRLAAESIFPAKSKNWEANTLYGILTNEKYVGDLLLQKTYREDFRSKRKIINHGERRMYFVANSHEAIIDKDTFDAVQEEMAKRRLQYCQQRKDKNLEIAPENLFAGIIVCGTCQRKYSRKNSNGKYSKVVWVCRGYFKFATHNCTSQKIPEEILVQKTKAVLGIECLTREIILEHIAKIIATKNTLAYVMKNGTVTTVQWEYPSRRLSWTPEMREAARQKELSRRKKEEK